MLADDAYLASEVSGWLGKHLNILALRFALQVQSQHFSPQEIRNPARFVVSAWLRSANLLARLAKKLAWLH